MSIIKPIKINNIKISLANKSNIVINQQAFVATEDLFPQWMTARPMLENLINSVKGFDVKMSKEKRSIDIGICFDISLFQVVPPEDIEQVSEIISQLPLYYMQDQEIFENYFLYKAMDQDLLNRILNEFHLNEQMIIQAGGRSLQNELLFRLGISPIGQ